MRSLTGTLFRGVLLGIVPVLLLAGSILYFSVNAQLVRRMDESLADKARMLALSVEEKHYGLEVDLEEMRSEEMEEGERAEYLYIGTLSDRVIYRSSALEGIPLAHSPGPPTEERHSWHLAPDGRKLRSVLFPYIPEVDDEIEEEISTVAGDPGVIIDKDTAPGERIVIQLFRDASDHIRFMKVFLIMLLVTGFGSIGVLSLTVWLAIKKGAEPINELASKIEAVNNEDLAVRLEEAAAIKELLPIVHKFNVFLDRLEESYNRERGFTSDAAHELRTPLAGLKSTIEVTLARKRESDEYRETLEGALQIVNQLESLVRSLLALARLESGQESVQGSRIDVESCVREVWSSCSGAANEKGVETAFNVSNGRGAMIDRDLLVQVLEELFRNAVYYVDDGGAVRVDLRHDDSGRIQLSISNTGSKVSSSEANRVFDRFWRGSNARNDTGVRFGLGLPIARKIVETMGADMDIRTEMDGEFVVTLTMPEG